MEFRNCEEYVLNELFKAQERVSALELENAKMAKLLDTTEEDLYKLEDVINSLIDTDYSDKTCIRFKTVYNTDEEFLKLIEYFPKLW